MTTGKKLAKRPAQPTKQDQQLQDAITTLRSLRDKQKTITDQIAEAQEEVLALMEEAGHNTYKFKVGQKLVTAHRQQNASMVYDEKQLKKRIGSKLWDRITTKALDKKKLEAHIASGEVDVADVAACATEKLTKPFVRIT